uniref:Uncharacterized protein n=1 Tax=candidate division CPR3 bacterium TaxID=2268181 RepID=A0A7C4M5Y3_UNCC3
MKKILLKVLILVLIAGGSIGGYWYGTKQKTKKPTTEKTTTESSNGIYLKDMRITDIGSDLKKYKNDKYGFEFSYPSSYDLDVDVKFESKSSIYLNNKNQDIGSFSVEVLYNPNLLDPLTKAKQDISNCLAEEKELIEKGESFLSNCYDSTDNWKVTKIDDRFTGYRTGIQLGTVLTDTYYLFDSQYKGLILQIKANIQNIPSRTEDQSNDIVLTAKNDKDVQNFLGIFEKIINSAKTNWLQ